MKNIFATTAVAALIIIATSASAAPDFRQITSAAEFGEIVVGKTLSRNTSSFTIDIDGTISGVYAGRSMQGTWAWVNGSFCRTLDVPKRRFNCQFVQTDGTQARFMPFMSRSNLSAMREVVARN